MKEYPNPHEYMERHLQEAALRDAESLKRAGLAPGETLTRAMSERAAKEGIDQYMLEVNSILEQNIRTIILDEQRRIRQIRRKEARLSILIFSFIALFCATIAGFDFGQHDLLTGMVYGAGAVLAMATLGAILDR
jgi:hypothetical protein